MWIIIVWVGAAALIGSGARNKGRSGFAWFLLALLLSPLLMVFFLLAARDRSRPAAPAAAPERAGRIRIERRPPTGGGGILQGDGAFRFPIVGESHCQPALAALAGDFDPEDGARDVRCLARLTPEPDNPYDPDAVRVTVRGAPVGYLSRRTAPAFLAALEEAGADWAECAATINGGWNRGEDDEGAFGVRLNATLPFVVATDAAPVATPAPVERRGSAVGALLVGALALLLGLAAIAGLGALGSRSREAALRPAASSIDAEPTASLIPASDGRIAAPSSPIPTPHLRPAGK